MNKKNTILTIDDEASQIKVYELFFSKEGYNIITTRSGEEGIEAFIKYSPDLVILDLLMPGMGGEEVLKRIKEINENTPVIICSGNSDIDLTVLTMKYGAYDYMMKPYDTAKLMTLVKKALSESKPEPKSELTPQIKEAHISKFKRIYGIGALLIVIIIMSFFLKPYLFKQRKSGVFYEMPYTHPTALALEKNSFLWVSDWYGQVIYKHKITENSLPLIKAHNIPNSSFTGLTFGRKYLWSCDSMAQTIYVHTLDEKLSIIKTYSSPGSGPSGLYFDGQNIWSCDNNTGYIYKHTRDDQLSVIKKYKSPGPNPVGIFGETEYIYTADADRGEIYKHKKDESLSVLETYKLDIFPVKIAGVVYDGQYLWVSIEDEAKICRFDFKKLQKKNKK